MTAETFILEHNSVGNYVNFGKSCEKSWKSAKFYVFIPSCIRVFNAKGKKRKKISWPIAQYNNEMEHTIDLSEYDGIRKMLNIKHKGKVPSKANIRGWSLWRV